MVYLSSIFVFVGFLALIVFPAQTSAAVCDALSLCAGTLIPALFPFFCLSGIASAMGITAKIGQKSQKLMSLLALPGEACVPLVAGLCAGYPMGAKMLCDMVKSGETDSETASRLLPMCNNTGPAFMIGVAGAGIFGSTQIGVMLYISHILAALSVGVIMCRGKSKACSITANSVSFSEALVSGVTGSALTAVNITAFVVFFAVIKSILSSCGIMSAVSLGLSAVLDVSQQFFDALATGILELGSGIHAMAGMTPSPQNAALCSFILGFGSLSVHCQTLAAVSEAKIKCTRHFVGRILSGLISALFTFILLSCL